MSKRAITLAVALALVLGGAAGFAWHAPGQASTWSDVRTWAGFGIIIIGAVVALVQLDLQRRQLASQQQTLEGEVERNRRRDMLLDKQLEELEQRVLARQQAEQVDLKFAVVRAPDPDADPSTRRSIQVAEVANNSPRPIRSATGRIQADPGSPLKPPKVVGQYVRWSGPGIISETRSIIDQEQRNDFPLLRAGESAALLFDVDSETHPDARMTVRFTDDAGLDWQIDHDLHLTQLRDSAGW